MERYQRLLEYNHEWIARQLNADPDYFKRQERGQHPSFLWIGCSDSRVVPGDLTGTLAGDMFVHRNIANLVKPSDVSMASVLELANVHFSVAHVIVCGHTHCGGVRIALEKQGPGPVHQWVEDIRKIRDAHREELDKLDPQVMWDRLVELNVQKQVERLAESPYIRTRWEEGAFPVLHGWVYSLCDGSLKDVVQLSGDSAIDSFAGNAWFEVDLSE